MAAGLIQNRPCLCNRSQHRPASVKSPTPLAASRTSSSPRLLPGALLGASNSTGIWISSNKDVSFAAQESRRPRSRNGSSGVRPSFARISTSMLVGSRGRFTKMEGAGWVEGEVNSSRRGTVVKATSKVVIMVDPVEAKRLAAAEMKAIQARAKRKRQTEIEAVNGGWALVGLTAGIVIEGYTGKSIFLQIAGYLDAVVDLLAPLTSL